MEELLTLYPNLWMPALASLLLGLAIVIGGEPLMETWDRFSRWWIADLLPVLEALNVDRTKLKQLLRWWGVAVVGGPLSLALGLGAPVLAIPLAILTVVAPRWWLQSVIDNRRDQIVSQLSGAMVGLANTVRAGLTLSAGLSSVADDVDEPLQSEFRWLVFQVRGGMALGEALENSKQRLKLDPFTLFAVTLQTLDEHGGPGPVVMERLSESLREMDRLNRHIRNATAGGRRVVMILSIFPVLFLGSFLLIYPEGAALMFSSLIGQALLTATIGLVFASIVWTRKILSFE